MNQSRGSGSGRVGFELARAALGLFSLGSALLCVPAFGQIVPDTTLGTENSRVNPNVNIRGIPGDRIDGGAVRGSSLFHSFSQFNVNNGQRVYFADPAGISNIFSRVTGSTPSNILGTLGVDGAANLFLLNPNGILFGPNALVDIQGSFVATTGDRFFFPNGAEFGASNPQAPPLLTMSVPVGVQYGPQPGNIVNTGNLTVGQDLTLAGGNLDLQGQLRAGRDLTLQAQNTVRSRDSAINPFIASAGGKLVVQGNQAVDIVALSHPNSGLFSGGDMVLRSANTVGGDAHYWSGGNFRIEKLDGNLGNLFSPADPVIRASGDVNFASYTGASLHIFAGGSVTITGGVTITGADTAANSIAENVTLSDGTTIDIDGSKPTLDIRAGTTAIGTPGIIGSTASFTPGVPATGGTPTSADITIGNVHFEEPNGSLTPDGGTVFLSNRYSPNSLPSPNGITVGAINTVGTSNSGSVLIDSRTNITVNKGIDTSTIVPSGYAGNINLLAAGDIVVNGFLDTSADSVQSDTSTTANKLTADQLVGFAGDVTLKAGGNIRLNPNSAIFAYGQIAGFVELNSGADTFITRSYIYTTTSSPPGSNSANTLSGAIFITARSLSIKDSTLDVGSFGSGDAGDIKINATNGSVFLDHSQVLAESQGDALAGDIFLDARDRIEITNGSTISGKGNVGTISVGTKLTPQTVVINNSKLTTNGETNQEAGQISIDASDLVLISNSELSSNSNSTDINSSFGNINVKATNGSVFLDHSTVLAESKGGAFAGDIFLDARDRIEITNNSTISGKGNLGRIFIGTNVEPQTVLIQNSQLKTDNPNGNGDTGGIEIQSGALTIRSDNSSLLPENRASITSTTKNGKGGDINITVRDLLLLRNGSYISASIEKGGNGNGGTINIEAKNGFVIAVPSENSDILATASGGQGGQIKIDANRVFGLKLQQNVNPTTLNDLLKNNTSDINASSDIGLEGSIEINTLSVDPSQGLDELPIDVVDPSNQIARGCGPTGGTTANRQSQFVVTGRGGLPPSPNDLQTPGTTSPGWVTRDVGNASRADIPDQPPTTASTDTLVEAQGMVKTAKGELLLTAQSPTSTPHQSGVSTQLCVPASDRR